VTTGAFAERWAARLGPDRWHPDRPLAGFTTFKVGGPAEWFAEIATVEELEALVSDAFASGVPVTVLGGGSNVLIADTGVRGVVVRLALDAIEQPAEDVVRAGAGVTVNGLVRWTVGRGLRALEAWAGTPGTVGGAIYGNAHWGGQNIGDLVTSVRVIDRHGRFGDVRAADMEFGYDTSRLKRTGEIVVHAEFRVSAGDPAALRDVARRSLHYRKATQPLALPSAGCVFQNPSSSDGVPEGIPRSAGALVDRAGLKGRRIGGASISDRHANFVVNNGAASARDIKALIELARSTVRERFGVELLDEVVYLGTFENG
jgi:UDP-N-acetylmuramate dehydrogenase